LSPEEAVHAYQAFANFTQAFVLIEQSMRSEELDPDVVQLLTIGVARVASDLPLINATGELVQALTLDDDSYRLGLELLVDGIRERYLTPTDRSTGVTRRPPARRTAQSAGR
jgi:hypothetical protein